MEKLKNIQELVNFLLRYVVAGGSAVLAFGLTQHDPFSFLRVGPELSVVLLLLFVSVIGAAIYAIHRAVLHPLILVPIFTALRQRNKLDKIRWWQWWKLDRALAVQREQWRAATPPDPVLSTYEGWAAQVHFLYCSAFGAGSAFGLTYFNPHANHVTEVLATGVILFVAAVVSDLRETNWEIQRAKEGSVKALIKT